MAKLDRTRVPPETHLTKLSDTSGRLTWYGSVDVAYGPGLAAGTKEEALAGVWELRAEFSQPFVDDAVERIVEMGRSQVNALREKGRSSVTTGYMRQADHISEFLDTVERGDWKGRG